MDIPEDIWTTADRVASEMSDLVINGTGGTGTVTGDELKMRQLIAAALLAERERCANGYIGRLQKAVSRKELELSKARQTILNLQREIDRLKKENAALHSGPRPVVSSSER